MANIYKFRTTPYAHQKQALRFLLKNEYGGGLFMSPRTGKTKTTIDYLCILAQQKKLDRVIVVAPNRVMGTWVRELQIHAPASIHTVVWDKERRQSRDKRGNPTIGDLPPVSGLYDLEVVIVNYEAFATPGRKTKSGRYSKTSGRFKVRSVLRKWLGGGKTAAMVLDESHKIKSPSGKAANMIVSMRDDVRYRLILTGTPITKAKRAYDIYMQFQFLNPDRFKEYPTLADFKDHFGRWAQASGPRPFPIYKGPRNMQELHRKMRMDGVVVKREDCFDLPPREDLVKFVDLGPSRAAYDQMAEEMIAELEDGTLTEASIALVQQLRLTQITSGFATNVDHQISRFGFEKADALKELLDEHWENGQKVVIAARWKADLSLIEDMSEELGFEVYPIRGGISRTESDQNVISFRETSEPAVCVIQPAAASLGIDLSTASHMIWYSHTPSWVNYTQACDRIALSRNSTTFTHLIAQGTVDEALLQTLKEDGEVADTIMSNPRQALFGKSLQVDKNKVID